MGIINFTPDSFSDGGDFFSIDKALQQTHKLILNGADIIDIGCQSTRPGAAEIGPSKELERIIPVLKEIRKCFPHILISIDTFNSQIAYECMENGANWINDVTGGRRDERILDVVAHFDCPFVITHSKGNSKNMNLLLNYDDLLIDMVDQLQRLTNKALDKNVSKAKIIWDPGLGFSKDTSQNIEILKNLYKFTEYNYPLLIGASRKRFIGEIINEEIPKQRDIASLAITSLCSQLKIHMVRVHNVEINHQLLKVSDKIYR